MKRRFARRGPSSDALQVAVADLVEAFVSDAFDDRQIRSLLDRETILPAEITRQAIAYAMRVAYAIQESNENAATGLAVGRFPACPSVAPHLERSIAASDRRRAAVDRLALAIATLSPDDLDQDVLGGLLSQLLTTPFVRHPAAREYEEDRARDAGGSYFTPCPIVETLLDMTLEPLLDEVCFGRPAPDREEALLNLSIVDPSCGSGRFLLTAANRVAKRLAQARSEGGHRDADEMQARVDVIERCLYGVDICPLAIEAFRFRLRREARKIGRILSTVERCTICGDSLFEIDWRALRGARPTDREGFDLVIGNPPWTSYSGRYRGPADAGSVAHLKERFPEISRWPALHSAMLALSTRIVREGGRVGLVLPLRLADLDVYAELRAEATVRVQLDRPVVDAGESAFADVVQPTGLFAFRADAEGSCSGAAPWPIARKERVVRAGAPDDRRVDELLAELEQLPKFPPRAFGDPGVHTGNVAAKLIVTGLGDGAAPIREGRDVVAYACLSPRRSVLTSVVLEPDEYYRISPLERYRQAPILLRQTADRPVAARHIEPTYFRNSLLACRGIDSLPDVVLVAFLNSALYASLHRRASGDATQRSFPQVKVRALQNLPLPTRGVAIPCPETRALFEEIERAASLAEAAASEGEAPDEELLERIERLILRVFGAPEALAPTLLERAGKASRSRGGQLK